jgi:hypothetical protein
MLFELFCGLIARNVARKSICLDQAGFREENFKLCPKTVGKFHVMTEMDFIL